MTSHHVYRPGRNKPLGAALVPAPPAWPAKPAPLVPTVPAEDPGALTVDQGRPEQHPAAVYLARLAPGSRRTMRQALEVAASLVSGGRHTAQTLEWAALRYQHVQALRGALAERYAAATATKMLAAVRGVLKEAWRLGLVDGEAYRRAADVAGVKGGTLPRGRALEAGELRALVQGCAADPAPAGARDVALLAILYAAGLRRAEAVALEFADYAPDTGAVTVHSGKGNRSRIAYVANGAAQALADWLAVRGDEPGPLFCPVDKAGHVTIRGLTPQAVLAIVGRRAARAGVVRFSPHDLRRTFISDLLDAGADLSTVQRLAGHANVQTTTRYDRRGEAVKREAAGKLHLPYSGRARAAAQPDPA